MNQQRLLGVLRSMLAGLAGFVVYGSWAYFINRNYGQDMALRAGLTQGSYSLVLTMSTTLLMEQLLILFKNTAAKVSITILVTSLITFVTAYAIQ